MGIDQKKINEMNLTSKYWNIEAKFYFQKLNNELLAQKIAEFELCSNTATFKFLKGQHQQTAATKVLYNKTNLLDLYATIIELTKFNCKRLKFYNLFHFIKEYSKKLLCIQLYIL